MRLATAFLVFRGLLLAAHDARADARANVNADGEVFRSPSRSAQARVDLRAGELAITAGERRRRLKLEHRELLKADFYVSDDGRWIVVLLKSVYNVGAKRDLGPDSVIAIVFCDEHEVGRVTYGQLGFSRQQQTVSHTIWSEDVHVDLRRRTIVLKEAKGFEPGPGPQHRAELRYDDKGVTVSTSVVAPPAPPPPSPQQRQLESIQAYADESAKITAWYLEETKKLNAAAGSMSDRELNQRVEQLTADYNRRMLKLQSTLTMPAPTAPKDVPVPRPQPQPQPDPFVYIPLACTLGDTRVEVSLPGYLGVLSQSHDDHACEYVLDTRRIAGGASLEVAPRLRIERLAKDTTRLGEKNAAGVPYRMDGTQRVIAGLREDGGPRFSIALVYSLPERDRKELMKVVVRTVRVKPAS